MKALIKNEREMEQFLASKGYKITDDEGCTDSTKVIDYAVEILGYETLVNEGTGDITFVKRNK